MQTAFDASPASDAGDSGAAESVREKCNGQDEDEREMDLENREAGEEEAGQERAERRKRRPSDNDRSRAGVDPAERDGGETLEIERRTRPPPLRWRGPAHRDIVQTLPTPKSSASGVGLAATVA